MLFAFFDHLVKWPWEDHILIYIQIQSIALMFRLLFFAFHLWAPHLRCLAVAFCANCLPSTLNRVAMLIQHMTWMCLCAMFFPHHYRWVWGGSQSMSRTRSLAKTNALFNFKTYHNSFLKNSLCFSCKFPKVPRLLSECSTVCCGIFRPI